MNRLSMAKLLKEFDRQARTLNIDEGFIAKTFKKDRSVFLIRETDDLFAVIQDGFTHQVYRGSFAQIKSDLHRAVKEEFPRSNMAWIKHYNQLPRTSLMRLKQPLLM